MVLFGVMIISFVMKVCMHQRTNPAFAYIKSFPLQDGHLPGNSVKSGLLRSAAQVSKRRVSIYIHIHGTSHNLHKLTSITSIVETYLSLLAAQVSRSDFPLYIPGTSLSQQPHH